MKEHYLISILIFYGIFLISCGVTAFSFIGSRAKTALISGGSSGVISMIIAHLISQQLSAAAYAGMFLSLALFCVFSWRATKTLFSIFKLIETAHEDLKSKGIAFLIISLMAVVSIIVFGFQVVIYF